MLDTFDRETNKILNPTKDKDNGIIYQFKHEYHWKDLQEIPESSGGCAVNLISRFDLVSLFNGTSTLFRLFNAKAILLEEKLWYYLTHSWKDNGVHTFPKGICPKVNVIARLEFELAYYDSAVHRFNHYTTRTPPNLICSISKYL